MLIFEITVALEVLCFRLSICHHKKISSFEKLIAVHCRYLRFANLNVGAIKTSYTQYIQTSMQEIIYMSTYV